MFNKTLIKMKSLQINDKENSLNVSQSESEDEDVSDLDEIKSLFPDIKCSEHNVASNESYILHLSATLDSSPNIAVGISDNTIEVCSLSDNNLATVTSLTEHTDVVVGVKFNTDNNNLLYTGSSDGSIRLWDLRTPKASVLQFRDTTEDERGKKVFSAFDISANNRLVSAGTELFAGDAYILFWDVRNSNLLGGYWESHTDDITQLKFHHTDSDRLISGSTDGLINLYDLNESSEDDALVDSFNSESSVESLAWCKIGNEDIISCVTHTADLQLWKLDMGEPYVHFRRGDIAKGMQKKSGNHTYVVNTHTAKAGLFVLCGSNAGDGECLRGLQISDKTLVPAFGFAGNKQIVRASWYNENMNLLLTGGEKGIVNAWRVNMMTEMNGQIRNKRKIK